MYTAKSSDKYENTLKEMRWNDAYMILGLEDQYMGNYNNNATHISTLAMHFGMVDMYTLLPWPCQLLLHVYDAHVALQSFYMSQIGDEPFHRNLCFMP